MLRLFNRYWSKPAAITFAVEIALIMLSVRLSFLIRFWNESGFEVDTWANLIRSITFTTVVLLSFYFNGLYDFLVYKPALASVIGFLRSLTFSALALGAVYYAIPFLFLGRGLLAISFSAAALSTAAWRVFLFLVLKHRLFNDRVLIVGADDSSVELAQEILKRDHLGYRLVGFCSDDADLQGVSLINPKVIGTTDQMCDLAIEHSASRIVVAQSDRRGRMNMDALLKCKTRGFTVEQDKSFLERLTGKIALDSMRIRSWLVFSEGFVISPYMLFLKRALDLGAAIVALILVAPLMIAIAMALAVSSRGPVLFSQERVGRESELFTLWKFRSMSVGAEKPGEAQWAAKSDPRVTKIGKILRKYRLDELPQLWNILRGEMSLVGPRPEREEFVSKLVEICPLYAQRFTVRPGLTGWAQIKAPYAASFEQSIEKLQFDLYYIKNLSIFLDLSILSSTFRAVLFGRGAH